MPFPWLGPVMGRESGVHPKHSKGLDCSPKLGKRQALIPCTGKFFFLDSDSLPILREHLLKNCRSAWPLALLALYPDPSLARHNSRCFNMCSLKERGWTYL